MTDEELARHRAALISQREDLQRLALSSKESAKTVTLDQSKVGRLSRMDALQGQQMAQETARRRTLQLQKIEVALRRMESGDYGFCVLCEEDIPTARLNIDPASARCMKCMDD